jgi:hypothetical protein
MKIRTAHPPCRPAGIGLLLCLALAALPAQAQWVWRDAAGNTTFSDSPPPPDIKPEAILRRPAEIAPSSSSGPAYDAGEASGAGSPNAQAPGAPAPGQAPNVKPANAPKSLAEQDADFRKRRDERLKAEQKEAEDQARAQQKASACSQAKGYLDMLQSGVRLMRPNPDGTRGFADDETRTAEIQKAQDNIAKNCD